MGNVKSESGGQIAFAESEIKFWLNMDRKMHWFRVEKIRSEPIGQIIFAESEITSWLNIGRKQLVSYGKYKI